MAERAKRQTKRDLGDFDAKHDADPVHLGDLDAKYAPEPPVPFPGYAVYGAPTWTAGPFVTAMTNASGADAVVMFHEPEKSVPPSRSLWRRMFPR